MYTRTTLNEQKSAFIGLYINNKISKVWFEDLNIISTLNMYAIEPKTDVLDTTLLKINVDMPKGFTWASDTLYIAPEHVSSKELPSFQQ